MQFFAKDGPLRNRAEVTAVSGNQCEVTYRALTAADQEPVIPSAGDKFSTRVTIPDKKDRLAFHLWYDLADLPPFESERATSKSRSATHDAREETARREHAEE